MELASDKMFRTVQRRVSEPSRQERALGPRPPVSREVLGRQVRENINTAWLWENNRT